MDINEFQGKSSGISRRRFGAFSSSTDPEKLAASVSGGILMFSSLILMVGGHFGIPLTDTQIAQAAAQIGTGIGGVWFIFGLVRKGAIFLQSRYGNNA